MLIYYRMYIHTSNNVYLDDIIDYFICYIVWYFDVDFFLCVCTRVCVCVCVCVQKPIHEMKWNEYGLSREVWDLPGISGLLFIRTCLKHWMSFNDAFEMLAPYCC